MSDAVVATIVMASTLWVYWDATNHRIGRVPGERSLLNLPAGAWATVTLLLWIVGFPAYLLSRSRLIRRAKAHPVEPRNRLVKLVLLAVAGIALMTFSMSVQPPPGAGAPGGEAGRPADPDPYPP